MKRLTVCVLLGAVILSGCRNGNGVKEFKTHQMSDERCSVITTDEGDFPWGNGFGVENSYDIAWPEKGMMTKEAMGELLLLYFSDSNATNMKEAAAHWLEFVNYYDDPDTYKKQQVDSLDETKEFYSYSHLKSSCRQDSILATFVVNRESYMVGGAHGYYTAEYMTVDVEKGTIVHLSDLLDTNLLGEAVAHAVEDLVVNKDVRECLYDEHIGAERMPITQNFMIDSNRSTITLVYQPYEIACYACGIQSIVLPIFWLSKHLPLTPYAKELFGEGCSID